MAADSVLPGRGLESEVRSRHRSLKSGRFVPPDPAEYEAFRGIVTRLLEEAQVEPDPGTGQTLVPSEATRSSLQSLGFEVTSHPDGIDPLWIVTEITDRARGAGMLIVRVGPDAGEWIPQRAATAASKVERGLITCPHPRSDKYSEILGVRLFERSRARAILVATVARSMQAPDGSKADPAHREDTFFQAACSAFDQTWDHGVHLQLHGFEARKLLEAQVELEVILSDGDPAGPAERTRQVADLLRGGVPGLLLGVWGEEVRKLGGTTNSQGRMLRRSGRNLFLHVEMSRELRATLCGDPSGPAPAEPLFLLALARVLGGR